jgi:hypothetical protein
METKTQTNQVHSHRWLLPVLLGLDALVAGGLSALMAVDRLLWKAADAYAPHNMDAASVVLDLIDDLLSYTAPCAVLLFFLALTTTAVAVWRSAKSRTMRYGVAALVTVVFLLSATSIGAWVLHVIQPPSILPVTPTPTPVAGESEPSSYGDAQTATWISSTSSSTTMRRPASIW